MKWALIYIVIKGHSVYAVNAYGPGEYFSEIYTCFAAREMLAVDLGVGPSGHFPPNMQAICVQVEEDPV